MIPSGGPVGSNPPASEARTAAPDKADPKTARAEALWRKFRLWLLVLVSAWAVKGADYGIHEFLPEDSELVREAGKVRAAVTSLRFDSMARDYFTYLRDGRGDEKAVEHVPDLPGIPALNAAKSRALSDKLKAISEGRRPESPWIEAVSTPIGLYRFLNRAWGAYYFTLVRAHGTGWLAVFLEALAFLYFALIFYGERVAALARGQKVERRPFLVHVFLVAVAIPLLASLLFMVFWLIAYFLSWAIVLVLGVSSILISHALAERVKKLADKALPT